MGYGGTRNIRHWLTNRRGAAFLLAVYFASLMFLLLGGVSLQRTMTEIKASLLSRDLHQSFWNAEAAFDQALIALRADNIPTFDTLGCTYQTVQFDKSIDSRGNYMICKATNPDGTINPTQYRVDLMGTSLTSAPVWITTFVERKIPQVTLTHAMVGLDNITLSHAIVGGMNTLQNPVQLAPESLTKDLFNGFNPTLIGQYNNQGNIATKATLHDALKILNKSQILGKLLTSSTGIASISPDSIQTEMGTGALPTSLVDFPPVRVPDNIPSLGDILLPSTRSVSPQGVVTIDHAWAAISPGAYRANGLVLQDASFSTNGSVDLYIKGDVAVTRSLLYGQAAGPEAELNHLKFSPPNLRIFVQPANASDKVHITKGSVVAGILYAPQMAVRIDRKSLLMGAMVSKTAQVGLMPDEPMSYAEDDSHKTQVYYDEAVGSQPVHPSLDSLQVTVLYYSVHKSLTEASALSANENAQMQKWFQFFNVVATPPPTPPPVSSPGPSYGGSCSLDVLHIYGLGW